MKVVISVERSQLRGVLQELGGSFSDMEIVINIKEEESKEKRPNYESLTTEDLERIQEKQKETEKKEDSEENRPQAFQSRGTYSASNQI